MPGSTRQRSQEIQATAMQVVAGVGVEKIDAMSTDAARLVMIGLYKQLQAEETVARDTARRHIARACQHQRHPDWQPAPDGWGGKRPSTSSETEKEAEHTPNQPARPTAGNSKEEKPG